MSDVIVSADVDSLLTSANFAEVRARLGLSNPSTDPVVVYIRSNGDDTTAQIGREDLPWQTLQAAYTEFGSAYGQDVILYDVGVGSYDVTLPETPVSLNVFGRGNSTQISVQTYGIDDCLVIAGVNATVTVIADAPEAYDNFLISLDGTGSTWSIGAESADIVIPPGTSAGDAAYLVYAALSAAGPMIGWSGTTVTYAVEGIYGIGLSTNPFMLVSSASPPVFKGGGPAGSVSITGGNAILSVFANGGAQTGSPSQGPGGNVTVIGNFTIQEVNTYSGEGYDSGQMGGYILLCGCYAQEGALRAASLGTGSISPIYLFNTLYYSSLITGSTIVTDASVDAGLYPIF